MVLCFTPRSLKTVCLDADTGDRSLIVMRRDGNLTMLFSRSGG